MEFLVVECSDRWLVVEADDRVVEVMGKRAEKVSV